MVLHGSFKSLTSKLSA